MMSTDVNTLLSVLGQPVETPPFKRASRKVSALCWDSRQVTPESIFLALPGEKVNGNDYIFKALQGGSPLIIATCAPSDALQAQAAEFESHIIFTKDVEETLGRIVSWYRDLLSATVIAVTGSSGKTTTKDLIASILSEFMLTVATEKNHNNEIGVPQTVLSADVSTQALVVEMGMRGMGQIERLCKFVRPEIAVITNIGVSHIELLGSRRNIAIAKGEIIAGLPDHDAHAVLCGDDDYTPFLIEKYCIPKGCPVVTFGFSSDCIVRGSDLVLDAMARPSFKITFPEGDCVSVSLPVAGRHSAMDALAAAAVAYCVGLGSSVVKKGLERAETTEMRMEVLHTDDGITVVNDAYNANPESMAAALDTLASMQTDGRKIAVLGDMGELGSDSVSMHRRMGELVAADELDLLVCIGPLSRNMASAACSGGMQAENVFQFDTVEEALGRLNTELAAGDTVLVKASHAMGLERIVDGLVG